MSVFGGFLALRIMGKSASRYLFPYGGLLNKKNKKKKKKTERLLITNSTFHNRNFTFKASYRINGTVELLKKMTNINFVKSLFGRQDPSLFTSTSLNY